MARPSNRSRATKKGWQTRRLNADKQRRAAAAALVAAAAQADLNADKRKRAAAAQDAEALETPTVARRIGANEPIPERRDAVAVVAEAIKQAEQEPPSAGVENRAPDGGPHARVRAEIAEGFTARREAERIQADIRAKKNLINRALVQAFMQVCHAQHDVDAKPEWVIIAGVTADALREVLGEHGY